MADNSSDPGYELVLDNRRLIIGFAVLILFFGGFFIVGFMEGKRQGYQAGVQTAAESASKPAESESQESDIPSADADSEAKATKEKAGQQSLDWYKNVRGQKQKPEIKPAPAAVNPPKDTTVAKRPAEPARKPAATTPSAPASYTVQVGAFRQREQAEAKAKLLRSRGFECRIELPKSPDELYLLKVGTYKSRADAVATQLRLKRDGFTSFIKTY